MLQLNPSIPVETPRGRGEAIGWIDYGKEEHLIWVVALDVTAEVWAFSNPNVRLCANPTIGRGKPSMFYRKEEGT